MAKNLGVRNTWIATITQTKSLETETHFIEFDDVWMNQHPVIDNLSFNILINLVSSFDELDGN